jgi:membrane protease YdiL (CAAX protease family)
VGLWVGTLGVPVLASRRWGTGSLRRDYGLALEWPRDVGLGVVIGILGQAVVYGIIGAVWIFHRKIDLGEQSADLAKNSHGWQFALLAVFVVVGAPVVEELFFRGLLLRALMRWMPAWGAVAISGACFGLLHAGTGDAAGTLALILALAAFGAMLAVAAVRTRRLGPAIVAHMVFNAVSMVQIFIGR